MSDEDEYRFDPEDFDDSGELIEDGTEATPAPLVIVGSLAAGVVLFAANPFVDPVGVAGREIALRNLSAFVFAAGLFAGAGVYAGQGERVLGAIHAAGAIGWVLLGLGMVVSNDRLLAAGGGLLVVGALALIAMAVRSVR